MSLGGFYMEGLIFGNILWYIVARCKFLVACLYNVNYTAYSMAQI